MNQIFFISCTAEKQNYSCTAEEMYAPSRNFRAAFQYALNRVDDKNSQIFILSAKHGLLSLTDFIDTYNVTLDDMKQRDRSEWGLRVYKSIVDRFDINNTLFVFLTSNMYADPIIKHLPMNHSETPLRDIQRFKRRTWLEQHTNDTSVHPASFPSLPNQTKSTMKPGKTTAALKRKTSTAPTKSDFEQALNNEQQKARSEGKTSLTITARDLHVIVGGYPGKNHRMSTCSDVMHSFLKKGYGGRVLSGPEKGRGASLRIIYYLAYKEDNGSTTKIKIGNNVLLTEKKEFQSSTLIPAIELRLISNLQRIPDDKPGWYRWWGPINALEALLNSPHISKKYLEELLPHLYVRRYDQDYFCIYVGVAINESIRERLNWHINQHHTESVVQNGILSTFRKSVSSLVAGNQYDEKATNTLIDKLMIEYTVMDMPIRDTATKEAIRRIEDNDLDRFVIPINIMGNKHDVLKPFLLDLKKARKQSLA